MADLKKFIEIFNSKWTQKFNKTYDYYKIQVLIQSPNQEHQLIPLQNVNLVLYLLKEIWIHHKGEEIIDLFD